MTRIYLYRPLVPPDWLHSTMWLVWAVLWLLGLYLLVGVLYVAWLMVGHPKTMAEAKSGWFHWHPENMHRMGGAEWFLAIVMIPTWPMWLSNRWYI